MARRMELLARTHPEFIARLHGRDFTFCRVNRRGKRIHFRLQLFGVFNITAMGLQHFIGDHRHCGAGIAIA